MLSVIICSVNSNALENVKGSIAATVGVEHEIITIDNQSGAYGICAAYNKGAEQARYPFLCFMHEDIQFETENWGQIVCTLLAEVQNGVVGIAGGDTISAVPSTWSVPFHSNEINIIQHYKRSDNKKERLCKTNEAVAGTYKKVIALDGVFLCTRKDIFDKIRFDEQTFPGFHGYDVDFSFRVGRSYTLLVTFNILIHHFSEGNTDRAWMKSVFDFRRKWKALLPASVYNLDEADYNLHHWNSLQVLLQHLNRLGYSRRFIYYTFFKYAFTKYFHLRRFLYTFRSLAGGTALK